ncbi:hypothetical protein GA0070560_13722 [Micromonospora halophytica]|uniref:Uncharacterized protein n=1 Tax=Micromonospora halophytica TaxID=47864 RepID=A0A1C5JJW5_9ACTN|nr:hypothetical protein GA0070560_13722 [Micromonospora halophytica]
MQPGPVATSGPNAPICRPIGPISSRNPHPTVSVVFEQVEGGPANAEATALAAEIHADRGVRRVDDLAHRHGVSPAAYARSLR